MDIRTPRLILRRPTLPDVPALFGFLGDPAAMQHTRHDKSLRDCRRRVALYEWHRRRDGCAPWTIVSKADGGIIGLGGLYADPFDPAWGIELSYWFHPRAWGQGYATELATASMAFADDVLRLPEVAAFARPENAASCRVLEKAGFAQVRFVPKIGRLLFRRPRHGAHCAA